MTPDTPRYIEAGPFASVVNRLIGHLVRHGVGLFGCRMLYVRGRKTGRWRGTPVDLLTVDGTRYLVAPRGHTHWIRDLRAADGRGELRLGRRVEPFTATEVPDADKPAVLRAYLRRWKWEAGVFFPGLGPDSADEDFRRVASGYPVFRLT